MLRLALDAMGGDNAPACVVRGADIACGDNPNLSVVFYGDQARITPLIQRARNLSSATIIHTTDEVSPDDTASQAVRRGKETSMWMAIASVADGHADAVVSAGNTGALMAMSKLQLRTMTGVTRPAIAAFFPTVGELMCMLDLGANLECDAENLVQFAILGQAFHRSLTGKEAPRLGLLNVGEEEQKGHEYLRAASRRLGDPELGVNYQGFVEGSDLTNGKLDVVVTDGFSGNIALKTAEGISSMFTRLLRRSFQKSILSRLGYMLARSALSDMRSHIDPRSYNGAVFLGLNGIAVKSHGGTDRIGFANAIRVASELVDHGFLPDVSAAIARANTILERKDDNG
ncbi:MAG: phosphate acyltransferase PlsX [Pseudomonadota bacterium]|nr:phosphate acyltransferase PlsX [Pseudomonadota bacterium]MEC8128304.1 phosphate acyltransferase PlsX [Pseudomonadota bacterium]